MSVKFGGAPHEDRDAVPFPEPRASAVLLDSEQVKAIVADARHELIERCIAVSFRWAVLRGTPQAREAAYDVARELRELEKEG